MSKEIVKDDLVDIKNIVTNASTWNKIKELLELHNTKGAIITESENNKEKLDMVLGRIDGEAREVISILENLEMYVYAKDLNIPDGASLTSDEEAQIAWIQPPRVQEEVVEEVSEEGLEGEGETTEDGESSDSDSDGGEETSE